ncbi:MAG TPA: DUF1003 domain-containing protein [Ktedonobacteraceae bacterium]|nr:DUF1003 domain-containing protein [Ktedonobacteraceae bacterium]
MDIVPGSESLVQKQTLTRHPSKELFDLKHFHFPIFKHEHPSVRNVNEIADEKLSPGQKVADWVANGMGSWNFIIGQTTILFFWIILNSVGWFLWKWDAYPFIAMNLLLSCQAAYAAPVIMMSQNRQSEKDRLTAQNDYETDRKGEEEIRHIMEHLDHQDKLILQIVKRLEDQHQVMMGHLHRLDPDLAQKLGAEIQQVSE